MLSFSLLLSLLCLTPTAVPIGVPGTMQQAPVYQLVGSVTGQAGKPLAGATVALANNRNSSVITNSVGQFLLPSPDATPALRFSFAGYYDTTAVMPATGTLVVEMRPVARYKKQLKKQVKSAKKAWEKA